MSLVVEDGMGLSNAESYVSTTELDAYFAKWGMSGLPDSAAKKEVLLRKATRAIDTLYSFDGEKLTSTQALQWPRSGSVPSGVPQVVKDATCEMAYVYLTVDPLAPLAAGEGGLVEITKEVGDLKTTKKWADGTYSSAAEQATRKVNLILAPVIEGSSSSFMVEVVRG